MRKVVAILIALAVGGMLTAGTAQAGILTPGPGPGQWTGNLDVHFGQITLTLLISGQPADSDTATMTGSMNVTIVNEPDPYASAIQLNSADIAVSNMSLNIDLGPFGGGADLATFGVTLGGSGPLTPASPVGPLTPGGVNTSVADLAGTTLALDGGVLTYFGSGAIGSALGQGTFDFGNSPLDLALPAGSTIMIEEADMGNGFTCITVTIPLNVAQSVLSTPLLAEAALNGLLILTGCKFIIPEPGTIVLFGLAAVGLIPLIRRRFKK